MILFSRYFARPPSFPSFAASRSQSDDCLDQVKLTSDNGLVCHGGLFFLSLDCKGFSTSPHLHYLGAVFRGPIRPLLQVRFQKPQIIAVCCLLVATLRTAMHSFFGAKWPQFVHFFGTDCEAKGDIAHLCRNLQKLAVIFATSTPCQQPHSFVHLNKIPTSIPPWRTQGHKWAMRGALGGHKRAISFGVKHIIS